jgi:membrane protein
MRSSAYFFLSLCLASASSLLVAVAHWPASAFFDRYRTLIAQFLPASLFGFLHRIEGIISPHEREFLSLAIIATFWVASSGFVTAMEALNIAYDAGDDRSFWHMRLLALGLAFTSGFFLLSALGIVLGGAGFGLWLTARVHIFGWLVQAGPYLHWGIPALLILLAAAALYLLGPNVKQRIPATVPGVLFAGVCCIAFCGLVEIGFRRFASLHISYVTLGASVLLMILWLNLTGLAILVGGALNLELSKLSAKGRLQEKHKASTYTKLDLAA